MKLKFVIFIFIFVHFSSLYGSSSKQPFLFYLDKEYSVKNQSIYNGSLGKSSQVQQNGRVDYLLFNVNKNTFTMENGTIVEHLLNSIKNPRLPYSHLLREDIKLCDEVISILLSWIANHHLGAYTIAYHFGLADKLFKGKHPEEINFESYHAQRIYLIDYLWRHYEEWKRQILPGLSHAIPDVFLEKDKTFQTKQIEITALTLGVLSNAITDLWETIENDKNPKQIMNLIKKEKIFKIIEFTKFNDGMRFISLSKEELHPTTQKHIINNIENFLDENLKSFSDYSFSENTRQFMVLNLTRLFHSALIISWAVELGRIAVGEFDPTLFTILSLTSLTEASEIRREYVKNLKESLLHKYNRYALKNNYLKMTCQKLLK